MQEISQREIKEARTWRHARGLSVEELSELTGYSKEAIWLMERGKTADGRKVGSFVWQRYRNCCAGIDAQIRSGINFEWGK